MSIMHFGTVNVAELPIFITMDNVNCFASHTSTAEATINARTFGDVTCRINGATNPVFEWIEPQFEAPGSPLYQIRRTNTTQNNVDLDSDPGFGPFEGVWQEVGVLAFWGFMLTGSPGNTASASFTVSIRQGTGPVLDTAIWNLSTTIVSGGGGGGGGCFTGNMLVLMFDGTEKPIADILAGEMVMSLNTETNKLVSAKVDNTMVPRICNIYEIKLSNGKTVETTSEHPFRTVDGRWASIDPAATYQNATLNVDAQLHEGMLLRGIESNAKITKIIDTGRKETVYNLSRVGSQHNYFVEGMCVHNKEDIEIE